MDVYIRRHQASAKKKYEKVIDLYTKGELLCMYFEDGSTIKIPLMHIFDIQHGYKESEQTP